jgi:hypothetical protein
VPVSRRRSKSGVLARSAARIQPTPPASDLDPKSHFDDSVVGNLEEITSEILGSAIKKLTASVGLTALTMAGAIQMRRAGWSRCRRTRRRVRSAPRTGAAGMMKVFGLVGGDLRLARNNTRRGTIDRAADRGIRWQIHARLRTTFVCAREFGQARFRPCHRVWSTRGHPIAIRRTPRLSLGSSRDTDASKRPREIRTTITCGTPAHRGEPSNCRPLSQASPMQIGLSALC